MNVKIAHFGELPPPPPLEFRPSTSRDHIVIICQNILHSTLIVDCTIVFVRIHFRACICKHWIQDFCHMLRNGLGSLHYAGDLALY
jgi:hypothetical protein